MDWNQVVVTGRDDMGLSPGPGLDFEHQGEGRVEDTNCLDLQFSYTVKPVIPSWQPVATELEMISSAVVGTARVEVDETLFDSARRAIGDKTIGTDDAWGETRALDAIQFAPQANGLIVSNTIVIEGDAPGDQADLDRYVQRFGLTPVPEAGFAPLAAVGMGWLAALGLVRRAPRVSSSVPVSYQHRAQNIPTELQIEATGAGGTNR